MISVVGLLYARYERILNMSEISLDEFKKLSNEEQRKSYKNMNNHDKYIFRLTDPAPFLNAETIGYIEVTEEERIKAREKIKEIQKRVNRILK